MYDIVERAAVAAIAVMGVVMVIAPRAVAKKSLRESKAGLMVVRILGAIITVGAIFVLLMIFGIIG